MNKYLTFKKELENDISAFPFMFAFSDGQFAEGMKKLGLEKDDTSKIYSIGGGSYIRKTDSKRMKEMFDRHEAKREELQKDDEYLHQAFKYELANHEFGYTYDPEPAIEAVGLELKDVEKDERLKKIFAEARREYLAENEDNF